MNYKDVARQICNKIVDTADNASDIRMLDTQFGIDIYLDGCTYEAVVVIPDKKSYDLGSRPEDYNGDSEQIENVQVESLIFAVKNFNVINGIAVFDCMDSIDAASVKCATLGFIANKIKEAGVENIIKAVVKMNANGKKQIASIQDVEYCNITSQPMFNGKIGLVIYCVELDKMLDLNYTPTITKIADQQMNDEMRFSESVKTLSKRFYESGTAFHEYTISFAVKGSNAVKHIDVEASTIEDAMKSFNEKVADELPNAKVTKITNMTCNGKLVSKKMLDTANDSLLDECDGASAGGDAGSAVAGGDVAGAVAYDTGDTAAEMAGTTTSEVLGKCEPGKGYMGKDNFYIPAKAKVPLHRWEAANGGSKRKKKGKYPYEKDMKVVVSMFEDDKAMLNEWGDPHGTYEFLHGKTWEEVVDEIKSKAKNPNDIKLPAYERWEAAQFDAPDESAHGPLSGCTIDEDQYKRQYLKEYFIHGIYKDGTFFELGPMKRKVASEYINLHKLSVNSRAFQQMADDQFRGVKETGRINGPLHIAKFKDGFYLVDGTSFKCGPFSNKQLARMYAMTFGYEMEKGPKTDKTEEGYTLEYPTFSFSYTMAGVPCMDIVVAEDLQRAMKQFDFQWRVFDNSRPTRDKFNTIQDLQRDLSLLFIKNIEIEQLTPDNVEEYEELANETGNPSTIPQLMSRCRNPKFKYFLGRENAKGKRLVVPSFNEDESIES